MGMWRERDVRTLLSIHRLEESPFLRHTSHYTQGGEGENGWFGTEYAFSQFSFPPRVRRRPSKFSAAKKVLEFERV